MLQLIYVIFTPAVELAIFILAILGIVIVNRKKGKKP